MWEQRTWASGVPFAQGKSCLQPVITAFEKAPPQAFGQISGPGPCFVPTQNIKRAVELLKLALQMARDDYETRRERQRQGTQLTKATGKYAGRSLKPTAHNRIIALRAAGQTIKQTADLTGSSPSRVKRIWAMHLGEASGHRQTRRGIGLPWQRTTSVCRSRLNA
jgi:hypothetical protein